MPSQVVAVTKGLVAVATNERRLGFVLLLHDRHGTPTTSASPSTSPCPAGHIILQEFSCTDRGFLVQRDGHNGLLVLWLGHRVQQRQQAVRGHLMLVVEGFIGLLMGGKKTQKDLNLLIQPFNRLLG